MPFGFRRKRGAIIGLLALLVFCITTVSAKSKSVDQLSIPEIEHELQKCSIVQSLNAVKALENTGSATYISKLFAVLFPGSPAVNAILATLYISGPPNFLLALCPPNIDPSSLSVMVAFAVGGLLGDTLFHLLPEIFLGEDSPEHVRFVMVEPKKNLLLGVAILVGFMTFVLMDKALRIATGRAGHDHSHGHSETIEPSAASSAVEKSGTGDARNRGKKASANESTAAVVQSKPEPSNSIKLGAYLNLIADFTHNITDGLAMSASFYTSPTIGATTTMAVFFHEIPHEVGDFALLIQSGFSKRAAMGAQFVTALGAMLGTLIGIAVQEFGGSSARSTGEAVVGLAGTSLQWGDLLLPFTAGTFLYVGTVAVIPEMLEVNAHAPKATEWRKTITQFAAVALGAGIMLYISW